MGFILLVLPFVAFGYLIQAWLRRTFVRLANDPNEIGMTGAEVARFILDRNGLGDVRIAPARGGPLSDNYDPRTRVVNLSQPVYEGRSVAAAAIGAHEVGHAIQHAKAFGAFRFRSALAPVAGIASRFWMFPLILAAAAGSRGLFLAAVAIYALVVLFQLVTLPVEFDASRRAMHELTSLGLGAGDEHSGARKMLTAAAFTYIAGALAAIGQLAIFALQIFGGRR